MAEKKPRKRNKALDGLASLRAAGAMSATFHPDGTLAGVVFGAAPVTLNPTKLWERSTEEKSRKSDLDAMDDLPSFPGDA